MNDKPDELARIRKRKMEALLKAQKVREEVEAASAERSKQREQVLQAIFEPDAFSYLKELKITKPQIAKKIEDVALALYLRQQLISPIPKMGVILVQRKLEGVEPTITVKRRGEDAVSFYEAVRKDLAEDDE
jgi:DNA-binding TFAR19-related protein (PDSD5 family)